MTNSSRCRVFIGSSNEGKSVAEALQEGLLPYSEVDMWSQGVFTPGEYALDSLTEQARKSDFAVLVATADDISESRGSTTPTPRDNVILELGLFIGALGRNRAYLLATTGIRLPSDVLGLTRLSYHDQQNPRSAVTGAVRQVRDQIQALGPRLAPSTHASSPPDHNSPLESELTKLTENAHAQGWVVKDTRTSLRLTSPSGNRHALSKATPEATRNDLRRFVAELRADGLRVSTALRRSPSTSPFS